MTDDPETSGPPMGTVEFIAPSHPGSGWDVACREVGKIIFDLGLTDSPVRITTMDGNGGGTAFEHVIGAPSGEDWPIVAASQATATGLAQNAYGGATVDQVRFLGAIGADCGVIAVPRDSPFLTLTDMINALKGDPTSVSFAGGSVIGGFDQIKLMMVLQDAGYEGSADIAYTGGQGGLNAVMQMLDGDADAMSGDMSEIVDVLGAGDIRVLGVLSQDRLPGFDKIPTAVEQGIDVVAVNWRGFYVSKDIPDAEFTAWANRLKTVAQSKEWKAALAGNGMMPFTLLGNDAQTWLDGVIASTKALSQELGIIE